MSTPSNIYQPTTENISEHAFKIILWVFTGLCTATFGLRLAIRFSSFRYLFAEDYIMSFAWAGLISIAVLLQLFLGDIYLTQKVENGSVLPSPDFPHRLLAGLRVDGVVLVLDTIGIWSIKFSFLLFFRRLGRQIQSYMIFWYAAFVFVTAAGATHIGLIPYTCLFTTLSHLTGKCSTTSAISHIYTQYIGSVIVDVASDVVVICFPIVIVWRTKLNWQQKAALTCIFLLVGFTIAVTIIRGSIFGGVYKSVAEVDRKVISTSWILFWFIIEYTVSFLIACLISFRSLWVRSEQKARDRQIEADKQKCIIMAQKNAIRAGSLRQRWHRFHDSMLNTFSNLEGTESGRPNSGFIQMEPASGAMTVDFSEWTSSDHTQSGVGHESSQGSTSSMIGHS